MKKIADPIRAAAYAKTKKALEFELAKKIRDHFNTGTLKIQLNTMVSHAMEELLQLDGWRPVWDKNTATLKALGAYGTPGNVIHHASCANIPPEFCGDLIRLYGEVIEEVEKGPLLAQKEAAKLGGDDYWAKSSVYDHVVPMVDLTTGKRPDPKKTRVRLAQKQKLGDESYRLIPRIQQFEPGYDPFVRDGHGNYEFNLDGRRKLKPRYVKPLRRHRADDETSQIGKGMERWTPQSEDLLCRIENTFGLRIGATISGTTTDTIFFVDRFMRDLELIDPDPIFYMLPFATIASEGHHSLIETVLPLALHGKIEYSIGLYGGLLPSHTRHYAKDAIESTLLDYESMPDNRLLLVFYEGPGKIGGCWEFEKTSADRIVFQRMARADDNMMKMFAGLQKGYMTELMLDGWYRKARRGRQNAPGLLMY